MSATAMPASTGHVARLASDLPTLRELGDAARILDQFLEETDGELTIELEELWNQLASDTRDKVVRWGLWIKNQEARVALLDGERMFYAVEASRINDRKKAIENGIERSKAALLYHLEIQGLERVDDLLVTVRQQKNNPSVIGELTDEQLQEMFADDVAHVFVARQPEQFSIDKQAVLAAARAGQDIPEGLAVVRKNSVRIV